MKWAKSVSRKGALAAFGMGAAMTLASGQANAVFVVDFEGLENGAPMNGTSISNGSYGISIAASGANLGAAIFDSTIGGPNDGGDDPDLLVDLGNVLILQNDMFPRMTGDNFSTPNDDPNGGAFMFGFTGPNDGPVGVESIDLIDIDAATEGVTVILTDMGGLMRTYLVTDNFTSPNTNEEVGTWDTLDLRTLDMQTGAGGGTATASEDDGFDQDAIVSMEVLFTGSAALDNIVLIPAPGAAALLLAPFALRRRRRTA
jgi:hypothetical protein